MKKKKTTLSPVESKKVIMENVIKLASKDGDIQEEGFLFLVGYYYPDNCIPVDDLDGLESFQVTLGAMYALCLDLAAIEDYENLTIVRDTIREVGKEVASYLEDEDEFEEFRLTQSYYQTQLHSIFSKLVK